MFNKLKFAAAALLLFNSWLLPTSVSAQADWEAFHMFKQNRFAEAKTKFIEALKTSPRDKTILYYLGVSASKTGDFRTALSAFSKAIVFSNFGDPISQNSLLALTNMRCAVRPYSCLYNDHAMRWTAESQPLKIYISSGLQLPAQYAGRVLSEAEYKTLCTSLKEPNFVRGLSVSKLYDPNDRNYTVQGLRFWEWASGERLLRYIETGNASDADIIVFYCDRWSNSAKNGVCLYPYQYSQPAIIQIVEGLKTNETPEAWARTRSSGAANLFGWAFGLQASRNPVDVMYEDRTFIRSRNGQSVAGLLSASENDRATFRILYGAPPDVKFISVARGK